MKTVATIEARMTSSRLPGKVLMPIVRKPALVHLVERLRRVAALDDIVVATTVNGEDDPIVDAMAAIDVPTYRGSEDDVMGRVADAGAMVGADVIVEVTGDCTLLAPEVISRAIALYRAGDCDVVSNTWKLSYPQGADAQVFAHRLLVEAAAATTDPAHREHVSLYFYEHPELYRIRHFEAPSEFHAPHLRFQLDYLEDLQFIQAVYEELYATTPAFSLPEIFDLLRRKPHLAALNSSVTEKPLRAEA
jgi:spore coat polysaccharide biosynthesis protein SpsF